MTHKVLVSRKNKSAIVLMGLFYKAVLTDAVSLDFFFLCHGLVELSAILDFVFKNCFSSCVLVNISPGSVFLFLFVLGLSCFEVPFLSLFYVRVSLLTAQLVQSCLLMHPARPSFILTNTLYIRSFENRDLYIIKSFFVFFWLLISFLIQYKKCPEYFRIVGSCTIS